MLHAHAQDTLHEPQRDAGHQYAPLGKEVVVPLGLRQRFQVFSVLLGDGESRYFRRTFGGELLTAGQQRADLMNREACLRDVLMGEDQSYRSGNRPAGAVQKQGVDGAGNSSSPAPRDVPEGSRSGFPCSRPDSAGDRPAP